VYPMPDRNVVQAQRKIARAPMQTAKLEASRPLKPTVDAVPVYDSMPEVLPQFAPDG